MDSPTKLRRDKGDIHEFHPKHHGIMEPTHEHRAGGWEDVCLTSARCFAFGRAWAPEKGRDVSFGVEPQKSRATCEPVACLFLPRSIKKLSLERVCFLN